MNLYKTNIDVLIKTLSLTKEVFGNLPIYTFNENDNSVIYDFVLSDTMEISVRDIIQINNKTYIKDIGYDEWLEDNIDDNEELFIEIISKRHPELKDIAIKVLRDEFVDENWESNWDAIKPIVYHYYLNDLEWEKVVLITNYC